MYFILNFINLQTKLFWKNFFFLIDQVSAILFYNKLDKISKEVISHIHFFKNQFFEDDYIFHWQKTRLLKLNSTKVQLRDPVTYKSSLGIINSNFVLLKNFFNLSFYNGVYRSAIVSLTEHITRSFSFGFYYLRGLLFILFIDACLTDDEPLWEPIEWSLVQTWILFTFTFAWAAENLIVSRYGSYTGRDKRVWMSWYKTFWLIEGYYVINYGIVCVFVCVPWYFEINYSLSFVYSWWHWYSRVFFYKFIALYSVLLLFAYLTQINLKWLNWKKCLIPVFLINIFIAYLIYTHFIMVFFGYFTDPVWYQKSRSIDYIQLSHGPSRWGWGPAKKDHFTYHNVKTVFWFKNDGPFASSFLMFHLFLFVCLFLLSFFWLSLLRRIWATKEIPTTFYTYCVSSLRQFFYLFLLLYAFIFISFLINYFRLPWDFYYFLNNTSWIFNFITILWDYPKLFTKLFY